jgi:hypothetical protein
MAMGDRLPLTKCSVCKRPVRRVAPSGPYFHAQDGSPVCVLQPA